MKQVFFNLVSMNLEADVFQEKSHKNSSLNIFHHIELSCISISTLLINLARPNRLNSYLYYSLCIMSSSNSIYCMAQLKYKCLVILKINSISENQSNKK